MGNYEEDCFFTRSVGGQRIGELRAVSVIRVAHVHAPVEATGQILPGKYIRITMVGADGAKVTALYSDEMWPQTLEGWLAVIKKPTGADDPQP